MLNSIVTVIMYNYRDKLQIKIREFCCEISKTLHNVTLFICLCIALLSQKGFKHKFLPTKVLQKSLIRITYWDFFSPQPDELGTIIPFHR